MRIFSGALLFLILYGGCAPRERPATVEPSPPAAAAVPRAVHPGVREVPTSNAYRGALERGTRSATGEPGPLHWQNRVTYRIEAELDPRTALLRGTQRIEYRNNSPGQLSSLVLNLYQNVFSENAPRNRFVPVTGGVTLERIAIEGRELERRTPNQIPMARDVSDAPVGYAIQGTLARIRLPRALGPGETVVVELDWRHTVPRAPSFRTGWEDTLGSSVFHVAQWYPQIATYDDLAGWAATPYLGDGEFYLEYGDFDVSITVPVGYLVGATGQLANTEEVLTEEAQARLAAARSTDGVARIVTEADLSADNATRQSIAGQLTWRFTASDVRDFAFATSAGYVWDATTASVPDGDGGVRRVPVHTLYRPGAPNWEDAAAFARHSTAFASELLIPYPFAQITVAEGPIGGMEYPMLVFIGKPASPLSLYGVIAHEIVHQWLPMLVGPDEAAHAWLDEGLATYVENLALADFFDVAEPFAGDLAVYLATAGTDAEVPLMRHTDLVSPFGARVVAAYIKPSLLLRSLQWVVGQQTFVEALNTFTREWSHQKPTPWDFFNTVERVSGMDLDWFFYPWWFETGVLDQAIVSVEGAETGRIRVTVEDRGQIPAPAAIVATTASGATVEARLPVEAWLDGAAMATVSLEAPGPVVRVELDPEQIFPDADFSNNVWEPAGPP